MPWWSWLVLGLMLCGAEMLLPGGFYLLFFGVGALSVGALLLVGVALPEWAQWLLFSVVAVGLLFALRSRLMGRLGVSEGDVDDTLIGEWATCSGQIAAQRQGSGELRGSVWTLHNCGEEPLEVGDRCQVERVVGLTLHVRKPSASE